MPRVTKISLGAAKRAAARAARETGLHLVLYGLCETSPLTPKRPARRPPIVPARRRRRMIVAMHQPHYLPWLGYMEKWDRADLFVVVDHVQFERKGFQNRNVIKSASGRVRLTVPVLQTSRGEAICEKEIDDRGWRERHRRAIALAYRRAPGYEEYAATLDDFLQLHSRRLVDVNLRCMRWLADALGIDTPVVRSSQLGATHERKTSMIAALCRKVGATTFLSGDGARTYLDVEELARAGVEVRWQQYTHPTYRQLYTERVGFVSHLSTLDLLMNEGQRSLDIIRDGARR